jgi:hypothetical protein
VTFVGILLGGAVGYMYGNSLEAALKAMFICAILTVLEVSISFDNAVVNASVLKDMTPLWQRRFLTWGMLIAVFGMRLIFPLLIVVMVTGLGPIESLKLAALRPEEYATVMLSVHHEIAAFGGSFLLLVALKYFFDVNKDVHWIAAIERPLAKMGKLESIEVAVALMLIFGLSHYVPKEEALPFVYSGIAGIITFLMVEGISSFLKVPAAHQQDIHRASVGMFLYLEVLDASFSFDGVVGAFAITNNLFIITIGLSIGAMFVRSLTIMMVEKGTLQAFKFLEHGAFWAVASLAIIMFLNTVTHIPEVITGLIGAAFIGMSIYSSRKRGVI